MTERRLDVALVERGLARSRSAAQQAIAAGQVSIAGRLASRPAQRVDDEAELRVTGGQPVGRAGQKLDAALDAFPVPVEGRLALDVGASTGGFTEALLKRGAAHVLAVDVGHDQLVTELRDDPRVTALDGVNARSLDAAALADLSGVPERPELVVADLSFISLTQVLPALRATARPDADFVLLVKPQFEVGRAGVRGGVVRSDTARAWAVRQVLALAADLGLGTTGVLRSPVTGAAGNIEVLVGLTASTGGRRSEWDQQIERATRAADFPTGDA